MNSAATVAPFSRDHLNVANLPQAKIPTIERAGATIHLIAGEIDGVKGGARTHTPMLMARVAWQGTADVTILIPQNFNAAIYVIAGAIEFPDGQAVTARQLCLLGNDGLGVRIHAAPGAMALVLAGATIGEPVASYGPFVMNTRAEIMQAVNDFQSGKMGRM